VTAEPRVGNTIGKAGATVVGVATKGACELSVVDVVFPAGASLVVVVVVGATVVVVVVVGVVGATVVGATVVVVVVSSGAAIWKIVTYRLPEPLVSVPVTTTVNTFPKSILGTVNVNTGRVETCMPSA